MKIYGDNVLYRVGEPLAGVGHLSVQALTLMSRGMDREERNFEWAMEALGRYGPVRNSSPGSGTILRGALDTTTTTPTSTSPKTKPKAKSIIPPAKGKGDSPSAIEYSLFFKETFVGPCLGTATMLSSLLHADIGIDGHNANTVYPRTTGIADMDWLVTDAPNLPLYARPRWAIEYSSSTSPPALIVDALPSTELCEVGPPLKPGVGLNLPFFPVFFQWLVECNGKIPFKWKEGGGPRRRWVDWEVWAWQRKVQRAFLGVSLLFLFFSLTVSV
jgi:hypothetical protein